MNMTYQVIALAILFSSMVTGFIIFRMQGMKLAPHFGALVLALIATLAAVITGIPVIVVAAAVLQVVVTLTAYTQLFEILRDNFQTSPGYSAHLALVTMLPVLAIAGLLM
ncbi:DUF5400 family protein [Methanoregula sp.]|uniref:DUF5400 family protein n=1 Tax=Methanoregula sp. TaxID=2052170 RepID=UPI002373C412|nr:DUF5400 family protein [Methanoregula sp.]MDD1687838.1 DUF5400 domain-containing protein [Methanoregula sp.]